MNNPKKTANLPPLRKGAWVDKLFDRDSGPDSDPDFVHTPLKAIFKQGPDYRDWHNTDAVPVVHAVCYLLGLHPEGRDAGRWMPEQVEDFEKAIEMASASISSGKLKTKEHGGVERVTQAAFLAWAAKKGYPIPSEMVLATPKRGRQKGDGAYDDSVLTKELHDLHVATGKRISLPDAKSVASRAEGYGTSDSLARRVLKNYKKEYKGDYEEM